MSIKAHPVLVVDSRPTIALHSKTATNVVEGLVVDSKSGVIGFRNHTIRVNTGVGIQWTVSAVDRTRVSLHRNQHNARV